MDCKKREARDVRVTTGPDFIFCCLQAKILGGPQTSVPTKITCMQAMISVEMVLLFAA